MLNPTSSKWKHFLIAHQCSQSSKIHRKDIVLATKVTQSYVFFYNYPAGLICGKYSLILLYDITVGKKLPALLRHVNSSTHLTSRLQIGGEFTFPFYITPGILWGTLGISTALLSLLICQVDSIHTSWFCSKLSSDTMKAMQREEEELHTQHEPSNDWQ